MTRLPAFAIDNADINGATLRTLAYAATSGQAGVVTPDSLKVTAGGGGNVSVAPGAATIPTRYTSSPSFNSYIVTSTSAETVAIPATGAGGGATRYIIARIDDPAYGGQSDPTEVFWRLEQVSSITGLAYPFVPLARITQPASTSTITNAMITDLRKVSTPRRTRDVRDLAVTTPVNLTSATYVDWPNAGITLDVPEWATKLQVRCDLLETLHSVGATDGEMILMFGNQPAYTSARRYDEAWGGSTARKDHTVVAAFNLPPEMRGTSQPLRIRARRIGGTGYLRADTYTQAYFDFEFIEAAA